GRRRRSAAGAGCWPDRRLRPRCRLGARPDAAGPAGRSPQGGCHAAHRRADAAGLRAPGDGFGAAGARLARRPHAGMQRECRARYPGARSVRPAAAPAMTTAFTAALPRRWPLPAGGCDCHVHIYDLDRHPLPQASPVSPPRATWSDYLALRARLGLSRCVIVQPVGYGFDNACTLSALRAARGSARAIVSMPAHVPEAELARWARAGVVGVRFQMLPGSGSLLSWADLPGIARRIAALDWHINLQLDGRTLPDREALLARLPCRVVIDHVGKFLEPVPTRHPAFASLLRLLDTGKVWVKLSAMYETSHAGAPTYQDVG